MMAMVFVWTVGDVIGCVVAGLLLTFFAVGFVVLSVRELIESMRGRYRAWRGGKGRGA